MNDFNVPDAGATFISAFSNQNDNMINFEIKCINLTVSAGAFSPKAEVTNGRAAMLGIAILLLLEQNAGASFF